MTWWMARQAQRRGVAWWSSHGLLWMWWDGFVWLCWWTAIWECRSGLCGCVGGRRFESVDRVRVAWRDVAWCSGLSFVGLCGCVGGWQSESVDRVCVTWRGVVWLDAPAWVLSEREAVTWREREREREREQRNEVRERADTFQWRRWGDRGKKEEMRRQWQWVQRE